MKKIVNKIKQNAKVITAFVLGAILTGGTVYAATVLPSSQVGYNNSASGLAATDVQGALDELYARSNIKTIALMQDFDKSSLPNTGDTAKVVDVRDGNVYTVKKLADGNVWMTENLRLINKTISNADSNLLAGETWTIPASSITGFSERNTNNAYLDSTYGGYYTFYTATAGWGTQSVTSGNAPKDICPKGWRLPTGYSGEFQTLYSNYGSSALMQGEPNFTLSGFVYNGAVDRQGLYGYYWSSTVHNAYNAYLSWLNSSTFSPQASSDNKFLGVSVRCIAK